MLAWPSFFHLQAMFFISLVIRICFHFYGWRTLAVMGFFSFPRGDLSFLGRRIRLGGKKGQVVADGHLAYIHARGQRTTNDFSLPPLLFLLLNCADFAALFLPCPVQSFPRFSRMYLFFSFLFRSIDPLLFLSFLSIFFFFFFSLGLLASR